ncbi:hypothetical protein PVAP13_9KG327232 [Panicum virgatum]|uniref:Uncharacterized protein n=1 Tax=Panicum virgatum TaxID=38727 RepID=A0A8T0NMJ7_PANVG|nr:hypothetical protein PVAP13_9KG327232 [Panicum virgatum]
MGFWRHHSTVSSTRRPRARAFKCVKAASHGPARLRAPPCALALRRPPVYVPTPWPIRPVYRPGQPVAIAVAFAASRSSLPRAAGGASSPSSVGGRPGGAGTGPADRDPTAGEAVRAAGAVAVFVHGEPNRLGRGGGGH